MKLALLLSLILACVPARGQVLFEEDFEGSIDEIHASFGNGTKGEGEVRLSSDTPAGSPGAQSLVLRGRLSGVSHLYHRLPQDESRLYVRYFVKYGGSGGFHHSGLHVGGYSPPSDWPQGDAGLKGVRENGDKLLSVAFEPYGFGRQDRLDFYMNWVDMQGPPYQGAYYGRTMLATESVPHVPDRWRCVEVMVQLDAGAGSADGELALWMDGALVQHFRPGSPLGAWDAAGNWVTSASGQPFEGFRWRDSPELGLNWVRVINYDAPHDVWVDDLVVSRERVGCGSGVGLDPGPQSRRQRTCIERVNQGVARIAQIRARANERCLERAEAPAELDGCLEEDPKGRLERAAQRLAALGTKSCLPEEPPELALGSDPLPAAAAARELPSELARDLLGRPALSAPKEDRAARRCQSGLLKRSHALSDAFWAEGQRAIADKLAGRGTDPAVNDGELATFVQGALSTSPRIARLGAAPPQRAADACAGEQDPASLFPGCAAADSVQLAACAERAARCRACELLRAANERLDVNCDLLDDETEDQSCGSAW